MKVDIGPYTSWIGPYQIAEKLLFWMDPKDDRVHKFGERLSGVDKDSLLLRVCNWIESKKKRRIKIRIDEYDTWGMDHTLALMIVPMLKQLKEKKHGIPQLDVLQYESCNWWPQQCFDFYIPGDEEVFEIAEKQWNEILDKMIFSFEQINQEDSDDQFWIVKPILDLKDYSEDKGKECFPVRWKVEGVYDHDGAKLYYDKVQEGYNLFGKYYRNLWD